MRTKLESLLNKNNIEKCLLILLLLLSTANMIYQGSRKEGYHVDEVYSYARLLFRSLCSEEELWRALYVRSIVIRDIKRKDRLDDIITDLVQSHHEDSFFRCLEEKEGRFLHCDLPLTEEITAMELGMWFEVTPKETVRVTVQSKINVGSFIANYLLSRRIKRVVRHLLHVLEDILAFHQKHPETDLYDEGEMLRWKEDKIAHLEQNK